MKLFLHSARSFNIEAHEVDLHKKKTFLPAYSGDPFWVIRTHGLPASFKLETTQTCHEPSRQWKTGRTLPTEGTADPPLPLRSTPRGSTFATRTKQQKRPLALRSNAFHPNLKIKGGWVGKQKLRSEFRSQESP